MAALSGVGESLNRLSALDAAAKEREMRHGLTMSELGLRREGMEAQNKLGLLQATYGRERDIAQEKRYADELARETARDAATEKRYADDLAEEKRQMTLLPVGVHLYNEYIAQGMTKDEVNAKIKEYVGDDMGAWKLMNMPTTLKNLPSTLQWMTQTARQDKRTAATVAKAETWGKVNDDAKYMSGLDMSKPENQKFVRMKQAEYRERGFYLAPVTKVEMQTRTEYAMDGTQKIVQIPVSTTAFMPVPMANAMPEEKKADFEEYQKGLMEQHPWAKTNNVALKAMAAEAYANPAKEKEIVDRWGNSTPAINPQGQQVKWNSVMSVTSADTTKAVKKRGAIPPIQRVLQPNITAKPISSNEDLAKARRIGIEGPESNTPFQDIVTDPFNYASAGIAGIVATAPRVLGRLAATSGLRVAPRVAANRVASPFVTESTPGAARTINPAMSRLRDVSRAVYPPEQTWWVPNKIRPDIPEFMSYGEGSYFRPISGF